MPHGEAGRPAWPQRFFLLLALLLCPAAATPALAGGPRLVSGQGWGVPSGYPVVWKTSQLLYFTDEGPLSPSVSHDQADAMVAAAAAVWNVPTSSLTLAQGGQLAEDVSIANVSVDSDGAHFPADVQLTNEGAIPVAIIYDADGSLIDLLLGQGASEPEGCLQNAVVGDIDDVHQNDASYGHATLILNGRCVGSVPEQLQQMQYQLARAFGRVLGASWSQTNDNVLTAQATITANQVAYWPLMHPLDAICEQLTFRCMSNPFQLRVDDLNTLAQLYPVYQGSVPPGKQGTSDDALNLWGILYFPTGQGMGWVNITTRRQNNDVMEDWETTSAITGDLYSQAAATPVNSTPQANSGAPVTGLDGYFVFRRVPLNGVSNVFFTTEAINPLYMGDLAVGPYVRPPVSPSGSPATFVDWSAISAGDRSVAAFATPDGAAASCNPGRDGSEDAPTQLDPSGWQPGLLCASGHSSWWSVAVAAGHTWTVEVTATDEQGAASVNKAQPVLGAWASTDSVGSQPTVASQLAPFNSLAPGMTQMSVGAASADASYRFSISDQYGAGRPDFTYNARVLYAATVAPATLGTSGGQITVTGMGFRQGNQVWVNGAPARVISWTPTQLVADAPSAAAAGASLNTPVTIAVVDPATNGETDIPAALSYFLVPNQLVLVQAPATLETGLTGAIPLTVRLLASDGLSPVANASITFTVESGSASFGACAGAGPCTVLTDAQGLAQTPVTGGAAGPVVLTATDNSLGGATLRVVLADSDPVRTLEFNTHTHYVAAGFTGASTATLTALQDGAAAVGVPIAWTPSPGLQAVAGDLATDAAGTATIAVQATDPGGAKGIETVTGCAWSGLCATWTRVAVDATQWTVSAMGYGQSVPQSASLGAVVLRITDPAGHALEGAPVQISQRVLAWEGACPSGQQCAAAPVLQVAQGTYTSDANGLVTLTPLDLPGIPQTVQIAAITGTSGFTTLTLVKTPEAAASSGL